MGTYRSSHPMMSEANRTASIPRFAYFPAGNIPPAARTGYNLFQTTHMNADAIPFRSVGHHVSVNAIPLRSLAPSPPNEPADNVNDVTIEHTKAKKPKVSKKASNDVVSKALKPKQTKKDPTKTPKKAKTTSTTSVPVAKREKKDLNFVTYEGNVDLSALPAPFCSCTGAPRQCYRWGAGGWQSSCCTINISEYPLPMSATRPGSRMAGRKMSSGAFEKLLQRLTADGYDLSEPVDLKEHWARHGTNKFVTIK